MTNSSVLTASDLARAEDQLARAVTDLASMSTGDTGLAFLREAARLLEGIQQMAAQAPLAKALEPSLRRIVQRSAQAQELLDSAAGFYRGWVWAAPPAAEDYTADGAWAPAGPASRVLAEA